MFFLEERWYRVVLRTWIWLLNIFRSVPAIAGNKSGNRRALLQIFKFKLEPQNVVSSTPFLSYPTCAFNLLSGKTWICWSYRQNKTFFGSTSPSASLSLLVVVSEFNYSAGNLHLNRCRSSKYIRRNGWYGYFGEPRPFYWTFACWRGRGHRVCQWIKEVVRWE